MSEQSIDWARIRRELAAPFAAADVKTKPGRGREQVSYVDARTVAERLDAVVGPENWAFDWLPMIVSEDAIHVVKGTLTIYGVSKSDIGDSEKIEPNKGAVSDALKRAAVLWGIGRYLYGGTAPAPEPQRAVVGQEPRNRPQATPNTPTAPNGARPPADAIPESSMTGVVINPGKTLAINAFKRAADTAGLSEDEQKALIKETYPNRGFSTLTEDEWRKLEQKCRAMYSDVPAPEEAPIF